MQSKIDKIMDSFNFERVEKAMKAVNWKWASGDVPTQPELRAIARYLLNEVSKHSLAKDQHASHSTGGFKATKYHGDYLQLEFVLADWDTFE